MKSMNLKNRLYGDGIHDDLPAIQEMLDTGVSCVYLPPPEKNYKISGTIYMHSNQELRLDRYTRICLADWSNCAMVKNADPEGWDSCITIDGGIWDMNHANQKPNPGHFPDPDTGLLNGEVLKQMGFDGTGRIMPEIYLGSCFIFNCIKNFYIGNVTIVNPVIYGIWLVYVEDFTVENIKFEYNEGSPKLWNMDGVHVEGGCKNGMIRNLKGACHDDMVALTSDDFLYGPVENIVVDGIYAEGSHSAVRMLSVNHPVRNIHVTNIFGSYYVYCIIMSKYNEKLVGRSRFENITIDNVYASICEGTVDVLGNYSPLITIGHDMDIKSLYISNLHRDETHCALPTIGIEKGTCIHEFSILHSEQTNATGAAMPFLKNDGEIENLYLCRVDSGDDETCCGSGIVRNLKCD